MSQVELTQLFTQKAEAVAAMVQEVPGLKAAFKYALDRTQEAGGKTMAAPGWDEAEVAQLAPMCEEAGIELITQGMRARGGELYTGLTRADFGSAETGTLVIDSQSEDLRLATMLSEIHIAVLSPDAIQPDLFALEHEVAKSFASPPGYMAFITGASRTADIERVLTIGVHGPTELHIILLEDGS